MIDISDDEFEINNKLTNKNKRLDRFEDDILSYISERKINEFWRPKFDRTQATTTSERSDRLVQQQTIDRTHEQEMSWVDSDQQQLKKQERQRRKNQS